MVMQPVVEDGAYGAPRWRLALWEQMSDKSGALANVVELGGFAWKYSVLVLVLHAREVQFLLFRLSSSLRL